MKSAIGFLIAILLAGCSEYSAEVLSYGIANNVVIQTELNEYLVSGEKHFIEEWSLAEKTQHIPSRVGTEFGIAYRINGATQN